MLRLSCISLFSVPVWTPPVPRTNGTTGPTTEAPHCRVYKCHNLPPDLEVSHLENRTKNALQCSNGSEHDRRERSCKVESEKVMECLIWESQGCEWRPRLPAETQTQPAAAHEGSALQRRDPDHY